MPFSGAKRFPFLAPATASSTLAALPVARSGRQSKESSLIFKPSYLCCQLNLSLLGTLCALPPTPLRTASGSQNGVWAQPWLGITGECTRSGVSVAKTPSLLGRMPWPRPPLPGPISRANCPSRTRNGSGSPPMLSLPSCRAAFLLHPIGLSCGHRSGTLQRTFSDWKPEPCCGRFDINSDPWMVCMPDTYV